MFQAHVFHVSVSNAMFVLWAWHRSIEMPTFSTNRINTMEREGVQGHITFIFSVLAQRISDADCTTRQDFRGQILRFVQIWYHTKWRVCCACQRGPSTVLHQRSGVMTNKLSRCFDSPTHTTEVNKLWHKCSKGTTRTDRRKTNTCSLPTMQKIHLVFPLQTNKQRTNKQTDRQWQYRMAVIVMRVYNFSYFKNQTLLYSVLDK